MGGMMAHTERLEHRPSHDDIGSGGIGPDMTAAVVAAQGFAPQGKRSAPALPVSHLECDVDKRVGVEFRRRGVDRRGRDAGRLGHLREQVVLLGRLPAAVHQDLRLGATGRGRGVRKRTSPNQTQSRADGTPLRAQPLTWMVVRRMPRAASPVLREYMGKARATAE